MNQFIQTLKSRCTQKYLSNENLGICYHNDEIAAVLEAAFSAPCHYPCDKAYQQGELDSPLPWRAYVLNNHNCQQLRAQFIKDGDATKMPALLASASHLILVTWLPDTPARARTENQLFLPTIRNMEHIAAASAAIQNILLSCHSMQMPNYWSSGGRLAKPAQLERLGIGPDELLLGAVFIFPKQNDLSAQQMIDTSISDGKLRSAKGELENCCKWITMPL